MDRYVIGVDGGGTKTQCALYNGNGEMMDIISWGPTGHEYFEDGFITLKSELDRMLTSILKRNNLTRHQINYSIFGLSGVDTLSQHKTISAIITELDIKNFTLCNDSYLGIKAGSSNGVGICAINGTGCNVVGIDEQGSMFQVGGIGNITGDKGGSNYLGSKIISSIYNSLFKEEKPTLLTDTVFRLLGIETKYDFTEVLTQKLENGEMKLNDFTPLIFDTANKGDEVSISILQKMGQEYAKSINGVIRQLNFNKDNELNIVLAGSVFAKGRNSTAIDTLKEKVRRDNCGRKFEFTVLNDPPVIGAVKWALENI